MAKEECQYHIRYGN